jgi:hypothetical protein
MNSPEKIQKVEPNFKQWKFLKSRAKNKSFIGGRGSGKSVTMGMQTGLLFNDFPRSTWVVAGLTYVHLDSIVIPSLREGLEMLGYHEYDAKTSPNGVYVLGLSPPKKWKRPYKMPGKKAYQFCMFFINGFTLRFVSQDTAKHHRGLSIDGLMVDESATMDFNFIQEVLLPAFRGMEKKMVPYKNHPWRYGFFQFSSASWTTEGNFIYDNEQKSNDEKEQRAKMTEEEKRANPPNYMFLESTYVDNQENLPANYAERLRDIMDPWKFEVEVLNQRVLKIPNGFYHSLNTAKQGYKDAYDYKYNSQRQKIWTSNDYHADLPMEISFDFNTDICWLLTCQESSNELRVIRSDFTKPIIKDDRDTKLYIKLVQDFCKRYSEHQKRDIYVYGDPNGNSTSAGTSNTNKTFFNEVSDELKKNGWRVFRRELSVYPGMKDKYSLINTLLEESNEHLPKLRFNINTNKALLIALQACKVKTDKTFKKDKSSEDKARLREYAADGTDALDYIVFAKYKKHLPSTGWKSTGVITLTR